MNINAKLTNYYDDLRKKNKLKKEQREQEIYKKIPKIQEIDKELQQMCFSITDNAVNGVDPDNIEYIIDILLSKKTKLLVKNGFSKNYLDDIFNCEICKDTGVVKGDFCKCYKEQKIKYLLENSNLNLEDDDQDFNNFNLSIFSVIPVEKEVESIDIKGNKIKKVVAGPSPRERIEKNKNYAMFFIEHIDDREIDGRAVKNLFFHGKPGTGKTFLSTCIAKELIKRGKSVVYKSFRDFIEDLRMHQFNSTEETAQNYELFLNCDLLVLDDISSKNMGEFFLEIFFNILNHRIIAGKKMVFSSNIPVEYFASAFDERTASRLMGCFFVLEFSGRDLRIPEKR